jgi:type VI protein secretion system component Hcp
MKWQWHWQWALSVAVVCAGVLFAGFARASYSEYLQLAGVTGESNPPGFHDAIHVLSLSVSKNALSETQLVDSSSPQIAITSQFNAATAAFYKNDPNAATAPFEEIQLHHLIVDTIQYDTISTQPKESISFQFETPATYLYLALPGGGSGSGLIPIDSLMLADNIFSIHKPIDTASPPLAAAFANGTLFPGASLLVYTDPTGGSGPDVSVVFSHVLISAIAQDAGGAQPGETISFEAEDASLPEPGAAALLALGAVVVAVRRRARLS